MINWNFKSIGISANHSNATIPPRTNRRSCRKSELISIFPEESLRILDIGAGPKPFVGRSHDQVVTVDFAPGFESDHVLDVTKEWPFDSDEFDLIYMSHVLEHFYPQDRDVLINKVHRSLKPEGLVFIRVPHRSSMQATGWEHYTFYGLNGLTSLCHGENPTLPTFRMIAAGVSLSIDFDGERSTLCGLGEWFLHRSFNLTDKIFCYIFGGIDEVQFLISKPVQRIEGE